MSEPVSGINPRMLIWARESAGYTPAEVAAAFKKDPRVIERWEQGEAAPTYVQLETLAYKLFKRPLALFFFPEPPPESDPRQEFRTLPETEIDELEADTRHKVREALASQIALAELTGGQNPVTPRLLRDVPLAVPADSQKVANQVRRYLGIGLDEQIGWGRKDEALKSWRAAVEEAGVFVFKDSFRQKDVSGFSLYHAEFPLIVINNSTTASRQIFTLFHELAHLLLHESGVTKKDDRFIEELSGEAYRVETFCNRFAADFLVPQADMAEQVKRLGLDLRAVETLADRYSVSREVVLRRMLDMKLINADRYRKQAAEWGDEFEATSATRKGSGGGNYYSTQATYLSERYASLAFSSYYRGAITPETLAGYLNVKVKSLPGLEQAVLQRAAKQVA